MRHHIHDMLSHRVQHVRIDVGEVRLQIGRQPAQRGNAFPFLSGGVARRDGRIFPQPSVHEARDLAGERNQIAVGQTGSHRGYRWQQGMLPQDDRRAIREWAGSFIGNRAISFFFWRQS
jgi:hypothetical protein